ncbi:hypothetical protein Fmac_018068 [Flemingia macrophylla]|uniref:4-hydroxyphenylpyruvate dioxygenase n=1 Tax=Flemingia macrophylla TaxID=520843 RepID=A0ABD1M3W5_9FABA
MCMVNQNVYADSANEFLLVVAVPMGLNPRGRRRRICLPRQLRALRRVGLPAGGDVVPDVGLHDPAAGPHCQEHGGAGDGCELPEGVELAGSTVSLPLNESVYRRKRKSQIKTYLKHNEGTGVHHLVLVSKDIFRTLREMRMQSSIVFLYRPYLELQTSELDVLGVYGKIRKRSTISLLEEKPSSDIREARVMEMHG